MKDSFDEATQRFQVHQSVDEVRRAINRTVPYDTLAEHRTTIEVHLLQQSKTS
jgi:hypothetical protein